MTRKLLTIVRRLRIEAAFAFAKGWNRFCVRKWQSTARQASTHEVALDWTWHWEYAGNWEGIYWHDTRKDKSYCLR